MSDRYVSVPMILSDPNPGFKVTVVYTYKSNILSLRTSYRDQVTIEH